MFSTGKRSLHSFSWKSRGCENNLKEHNTVGTCDKLMQEDKNTWTYPAKIELINGQPVIISAVISRFMELHFTVLHQNVFWVRCILLHKRYDNTCIISIVHIPGITDVFFGYHSIIKQLVCVCASYWFIIFIAKWLIRFVSNKKGLLNKRAPSTWWHN